MNMYENECFHDNICMSIYKLTYKHLLCSLGKTAQTALAQRGALILTFTSGLNKMSLWIQNSSISFHYIEKTVNVKSENLNLE